MSQKILLYRTSGTTAPTELDYGEVAVQYNANDPKLYFKDTEGEIRSIQPLEAGDNIEISNGIISATDTIYNDTEVKGLITTNTTNINNLHTSLDAVTGRVDTIEDDVEIIGVDLETAKTNITNLQSNYTTLSNTVATKASQSSVDTLTTQVGTNTTNIGNLQTSKQDTLVSGTNIKTINNQSILGSGNITIGGGGEGDGTVVQNPLTSSGNYPILLKNSTSTTQEQAQVNFNSNVTVNPNTGLIKTTKIGFGNNADVVNISANGMQLVLSGQYVNIGQGSDGVRIGGSSTTNAAIVGGDGTVTAKGFSSLTGGNATEVWTTNGDKQQLYSATTVTTVSSIPTNVNVVLANISSNGTLSFASLPKEGQDVHVIIRNNATLSIAVMLPSSGSYICTSDDTIYISPTCYGEVNVVTINGVGYVHGINSI